MLGSRILGTALLIGGAVAVVGAVVFAPRALRIARPAVREALKRSMEMYERARSAGAEFAEDVEDLVAEVRAELDERVAAVREKKAGADN